MFIPDYLFYRFATLFYKGDGSGGSRAVIIVSAMYYAISWALSYCILCFLVGGTSAGGLWINNNSVLVDTYIYGSLLLICLLTHFRYRHKLGIYVLKWGNDKPIQAIIKTTIVISVLFSVFIFSYQIVRYSQF